MNENTCTERAFSVIRAHNNTGNSVGPLKKWLKELYEEKGSIGKEYREALAKINRDNALADKVSGLVEKHSADKGQPWKRNLGKGAASGGNKENAPPLQW
jgi:hypothetical protein